jgi:haloacetate dehalogenase
MFDGFDEFDIPTLGTTTHGCRGGEGPPILWHRVAPRLAERFTVIATDLRGYGDRGALRRDTIMRRTACARSLATKLRS